MYDHGLSLSWVVFNRHQAENNQMNQAENNRMNQGGTIWTLCSLPNTTLLSLSLNLYPQTVADRRGSAAPDN
jgi:hypothetical protein